MRILEFPLRVEGCTIEKNIELLVTQVTTLSSGYHAPQHIRIGISFSTKDTRGHVTGFFKLLRLALFRIWFLFFLRLLAFVLRQKRLLWFVKRLRRLWWSLFLARWAMQRKIYRFLGVIFDFWLRDPLDSSILVAIVLAEVSVMQLQYDSNWDVVVYGKLEHIQ